jgi:intracellular sulfur oxidation DsrE/DsrF family protein
LLEPAHQEKPAKSKGGSIMTRLFMSIAALVAAVVFSFASADVASAEGYGKQKVVYHINYDGGPESRAYKGAMRNIQNHINAVGAENLDIKVVLHGNGLGVLMSAMQDDALQTAVSSLKGQNVSFQVCNNTLKGREISYEDDLYDVWEEDIVPSGVAELSRLQQMGYTYIKP